MSERKPETDAGFSDATWAYNRWPTIGLYTGAGVGVALGVVFYWWWLWTALLAGGLAVAGCLGGFGLARLVHGRAARRPEDAGR